MWEESLLKQYCQTAYGSWTQCSSALPYGIRFTKGLSKNLKYLSCRCLSSVYMLWIYMASQLPSQRVKADTFLQNTISRITHSLENILSQYCQKTEVIHVVHPLMKHVFEQIVLPFRGHLWQMIAMHIRPSIYFRAGRSLNKVKFSAKICIIRKNCKPDSNSCLLFHMCWGVLENFTQMWWDCWYKVRISRKLALVWKNSTHHCQSLTTRG